MRNTNYTNKSSALKSFHGVKKFIVRHIVLLCVAIVAVVTLYSCHSLALKRHTMSLLSFAGDAIVVAVEALLVARIRASDVIDAGFECFGTVSKLTAVAGS